jgi:proline iminopeptidase
MKIQFFFFLLWITASVHSYAQVGYYITSEDQTKLYVEEFGNGNPIIFLAGGPGLNPNYLEAVWENVSADYRTIILHQRGTGKSIIQSVDSTSMSMDNYINDIEALRKHLKLEKITIAGHSWGGMLAMEYASKLPNRAEKLILLAPGGPTSKFLSYFSDNINMRLYDSDRKAKVIQDSINQSALIAIYPGYFYDRAKALENQSKINWETFNFQVGVNKYTMSNFFSAEAQRVELIKTFEGPVIIIQGRQDPIGESTVYEIIETLPQSRVNFIEKCGHFPWLENDEQHNEFYKLLKSAIEIK